MIDSATLKKQYPKERLPFIETQYKKLLDLLGELSDTIQHQHADALSNKLEGSEATGSGMHQGDAGSEAYDREFALNLLGKEADSLHEIEEAINRVENGKYGTCEMSGDLIPEMRLEAIPFTRFTVECQAKWEEQQKLNNQRNGSEFGFGAFAEQSSSNKLDGE